MKRLRGLKRLLNKQLNPPHLLTPPGLVYPQIHGLIHGQRYSSTIKPANCSFQSGTRSIGLGNPIQRARAIQSLSGNEKYIIYSPSDEAYTCLPITKTLTAFWDLPEQIMPANGKPFGQRFTLPALTPVSFSLTEGTDIPAPPDSPIEEKPPPPAPKDQTANPTSTPPIDGHSAITPSAANGVYDGRGRTTTTVDHPPMSPASVRSSSIRRFLSRKSLNTNYTNGTNHNGSYEDLTSTGRPDSPSSFLSGRPSLIKKKSGSWFSKLGGGSGKRTSVVYENPAPEVVKHMGPPPPKLPELNQLKAKIADDDEGSLGGGEMFKNIRGE